MILQSGGNMTGGREPLNLNLSPRKFCGGSFCGRGDPKFLNCYATSSDHLKKMSTDLDCERPLPSVTTLPSFVVIGLVEEEASHPK